MKKRSTNGAVLFFLVLAAALTGVGTVWGVRRFNCFEQLLQSHENRSQLLSAMGLTALAFLALGVGIGILILLIGHFAARSARLRRETEALRQKNEAIDALTQKTRELAHHQRLETIGTLTASIAHEFNNLLTPIMGYSMMALEKLPPEEEDLYEDLLEIYNASLKAKNIISRLNDLSRKNPGQHFRRVSPDELVRKTLDVAAPAKPPKVTVRLDLNCWDQRIEANEIQISQLLLNLILNGFQAMGDREGLLTVATSFDERDILIRVTDTGCGIPPELREQIFEPFFTTKEAGKGTGLGLAIVAQVVEDHHGQIQLDSQPGNGTAITVTLPRSAEGG